MAEVVLENVSRVYPGGALAVDSVSLVVHDQEFLVLVGPSGCGKSTTLRMIAGLEEISSGEIRIARRLVNQIAPRDRDIAMVFQNYALYPHMTVRRNMAFGLQLRYGGSLPARLVRRLVRPHEAAALAQKRSTIDQRVETVAQTLGIAHLLDRLPGQLSGGERQRVALGRAIVREPAAFLFDEPLSNLDAKLRVEMRKELKQLHERLKTTMIYVTHDQVEALTLGQRIAVMHAGTLQQVGPAMEVYDRPANKFVAGFIGTPPMNFLDGHLVRQGDRIQFCSANWKVPLTVEQQTRLQASVADASRVTLGVRPEDVRLRPSEPGDARVTLVEPLGDSVLVHFEWRQTAAALSTWVGKAEARSAWQTGALVEVDCDAPRVHLFATETGKNLLLD